MWTKTGLRWLVLSFLVHCVHTQLSHSSIGPVKANDTTTTPATTAPVKTTSAPVTMKGTTTAPPTTTAPTTTPQPTTAATTTTTTVKPPVPATATQKPSTPPAGGGAVQQPSITTVSKLQEQSTATTPKGGDQSPSPQVRTTPRGSPPPPPPSHITRLTQTPAPKGPSQTPDTNAPVTTENQRITVTLPVTNPVTVVTATKQAEKDDKSADGTTTAVTFKTSPDQNRGSTAPPRTPAPQTSTKAPTAMTRGKTSTETSPSTTESRVQTRVQTTPPTVTTAFPPAVQKTFSYSLNSGLQPGEEKDLVATCQQLMTSYEDGNCTLMYVYSNGRLQFDSADVSGKVKPGIVKQVFDDVSKKPSDNRTLITILASCGALLLMIVILAVCASHHRKPYSETQRPLTDELQAVENGYHDNPTLEVMEVQGAEPEKKMALNLNGEFNDSWIVPMENLLKEEGPDEEDTHL